MTPEGSATVMTTFGVICACVGFEDGRPSTSTTLLGMNLRCAENVNVWLKTTNTVAEPPVVEYENSLYNDNTKKDAKYTAKSVGRADVGGRRFKSRPCNFCLINLKLFQILCSYFPCSFKLKYNLKYKVASPMARTIEWLLNSTHPDKDIGKEERQPNLLSRPKCLGNLFLTLNKTIPCPLPIVKTSPAPPPPRPPRSVLTVTQTKICNRGLLGRLVAAVLPGKITYINNLYRGRPGEAHFHRAHHFTIYNKLVERITH